MNVLLDTNVISELVATQPNANVVQWIDALDPASVYLSVITIGELRKGIEKLPALDLLIAAIASHHACILATRNINDFRATGIALINPWEEAPPG